MTQGLNRSAHDLLRPTDRDTMTFSILGYCGSTGMLGIAIASSSVCVGSHCPWVRTGVGAVTVQYMADPTIGFEVLDLLESGMSAADAVARVIDGRPHADYRQVAAIDCRGTTAHFTGRSMGLQEKMKTNNQR